MYTNTGNSYTSASYALNIFPTLYLKPEVIITNDNIEANDIGSFNNPYLINLS